MYINTNRKDTKSFMQVKNTQSYFIEKTGWAQSMYLYINILMFPRTQYISSNSN